MKKMSVIGRSLIFCGLFLLLFLSSCTSKTEPNVAACEETLAKLQLRLEKVNNCQTADACAARKIGKPFDDIVYFINKEKLGQMLDEISSYEKTCDVPLTIQDISGPFSCVENKCRLADGREPTTKPKPSGSGVAACKFPTFTLHPQGNPLKRDNGEPFIVADPSVLFDAGKFKMWFTTGTNTVTGTGYAESSDGLVWTQRQTSLPGDVIIQPLRETWQHNGRETVSVLKKDNLYQMWYTGYPNCWFIDSSQATGCGRIVTVGYATSSDGVTWTDYAKNPVLVPDKNIPWEGPFSKVVETEGNRLYWQSGADEPTVVWDEATQQYKLWYTSAQTVQGVWQSKIGYATSADGVTWKKYAGNPVFTPPPAQQKSGYIVGHTNVIQDPQYGYHLFYHGGPSTSTARVGHAWSPDGITWERDPTNPVVDLGSTTHPNGEKTVVLTGGPSALYKDGKIYLYFMAAKSAKAGYGTFSSATMHLATADCS